MVGKRVVGEVIVVEVRLNVNLMALTIEQVIAKMQRSHIQMLDTMIDRQKQDLTEEEVVAGPADQLEDLSIRPNPPHSWEDTLDQVRDDNIKKQLLYPLH